MKKTLLVILITILAINLFGYSKKDMKAFEEVLSKANLTTKDIQLQPEHYRGGGKWGLTDFYELWDNWTLISPYANNLGKEILAPQSSIAPIVNLGFNYLDAKLTPEDKSAINKNIKEIINLSKSKKSFENALTSVNAKNIDAKDISINKLPQDIKTTVATLIYASNVAQKYRNAAINGNPQDLFYQARSVSSLAGDSINLNKMLSGAYILSYFIDNVTKQLPSTKDSFYISIDTDLGTIEISNGMDNTYNKENSFLVIDLSGNDTYGKEYAGTNPTKPISIVIDKKGNDKYNSTADDSYGAGILGYGILIDMQGNDEYTVNSFGLGAGFGGVGILADYSGNDKYIGDTGCIGASSIGIGYLRDITGDDNYYAYICSQGYGGPLGFGILAEDSGNDNYEADDKNIKNPSPQTAQHNTSLSQGAGFGHRDAQAAGGIGILVDKKGNDKYSTGVFGQGISYWYSLGFLVDLEGNDIHKAVWYCYGAAAHYSVAGFFDNSGNDYYETNTAFGVGHDYSIGYFEDLKGNDKYILPAALLGWGNANGLGIFIDSLGNDDYSQVAGLANSAGTWSQHKCYGIFVDSDGKNIMPTNDANFYKDNIWVRVDESNPNSRGLGINK